MVRNVVDVSLGVVAPAMVGATNRVPFDMLTSDFSDNQHGTRVLGEMGAHVLAVGIENDGVAALSSVQCEVTTKEGHAYGAVIDFSAFCDDEPTSGVGVGPKP